MREFTDAELELAPKVAEVMGPHKLEKGDWYINEHDPCSEDDPAYGGYVETHVYCYPSSHCPSGGKDTWLPSIEDCLEWLRERFDSIELWLSARNGKWYCRLGGSGSVCGLWELGGTPLEPLYWCIVAVGGKDE